jgi:hypothetical protein
MGVIVHYVTRPLQRNDPVEVTRCFFDKREGNRPTKINQYSEMHPRYKSCLLNIYMGLSQKDEESVVMGRRYFKPGL